MNCSKFLSTTQTEINMTKFVVGFISGIVVATIGFSGVASLGDKGVDKIKEVSREAAK